MPKPKERCVETLVQSTREEVGDIVRSKLFADPKEILAAKNRFQTAHTQAM